MNQAILYFVRLVFAASLICQANAAYNCFECGYVDLFDELNSCIDPSLDLTNTRSTCSVGCYALDAHFIIGEDEEKKNITRVILRGCASPAYAVGGCLRGNSLLNFYTDNIVPWLGGYAPKVDGLHNGSICSCTSNTCNSGVTWQPTFFLITLMALCGFVVTVV